MYKRTTVMTLPPDAAIEHWVFPADHCAKMNSTWVKRIYGERFYSDDGRIFTTINIWEDKDAYLEFAQDPNTIIVRNSLVEWSTQHNCTLEVTEEEI